MKKNIYDINHLKDTLGQKMCSRFLFIHAMIRCDSISCIIGIEKKTVFQKCVKGDPVLRSLANEFTVPNQTLEEIGVPCDICFFVGKSTDPLATLQYNILSKRVVSASTHVTPERLPPIESAIKLNCPRAY